MLLRRPSAALFSLFLFHIALLSSPVLADVLEVPVEVSGVIGYETIPINVPAFPDPIQVVSIHVTGTYVGHSDYNCPGPVEGYTAGPGGLVVRIDDDLYAEPAGGNVVKPDEGFFDITIPLVPREPFGWLFLEDGKAEINFFEYSDWDYTYTTGCGLAGTGFNAVATAELIIEYGSGVATSPSTWGALKALYR